MLNRSIVLVIALLTLCSCHKKHKGEADVNNKDGSYSITVNLNDLNSPSAKMYLANTVIAAKPKDIIDSASIKNATFYFKGKIEEPKLVYLFINKKGNGFKGAIDGFIMMYLEAADMIISSDDLLQTVTITGSDLNTEYKKFVSQTKMPQRFNKESVSLIKATKNAQSIEEKEILKKQQVRLTRKRSKYKDSVLLAFINQNLDSYFSLEALELLDRKGVDENNLMPLFEDLSPKLRSSKRGVEVLESIKRKRAEKGKLAPDFAQNDENDNPVKLSDYRGKYVLLDFWASWCGPCRAENPNLLEAYEKYHSKGLEILAVSLDTKRKLWVKAIEQENLPWTHVSDLKGFKNEAAVLYDVKVIPKNLLIDPDGKIITTNLRGYRLEEKLSEIFKK